ncbi:anthrax toxin receptor-like isoform X1 [Neophocaena asiaeorientalis asiaeorientalis]|uniref:Anthrax toxin receptor-like isoform X1 n=1 Tax=Neophocaena asiaeorientalis asiaeorientalis TaxID=1706337 RepID=A0A341ABD6_NEOAA|nr:anthrax toxin receptor-like isoform X1 [Neophocaena asiaeorientalis asiaeorientalis]XP_024587214.1 anthrax toxin receptor-like isoform X1 [Neophocaena asiaeorientalis asiaeorientalis]
MRMSFITYSTLGHTLMKLTSDRNEIRDGLSRLQNIVPSGATNMQEGFKKANEQIHRAYLVDSSASSLIITLTTGPLLLRTLRATKSEAAKARNMGAKVYCLGMKDYKKHQLYDIVERKDQMYGIDEFKSLEKLVSSLVENSCMEVTAGDTYFVCSGESYDVTFFTTDLDQQRKDEIVCRYKLGFSKVYDKTPTFLNQEKFICPGHTFDKAGQEVLIDYSLNNGVTFTGEDMKIASKDCVNEKEKLDTFYDFVQHCSQLPLMWCPPRDMGRCINFTLMNPHCTQMFRGPKICLQPSQECFPLSSCCSHGQHLPPICSQSLTRMLPLIPRTARKLCRSTLSLPPP